MVGQRISYVSLTGRVYTGIIFCISRASKTVVVLGDPGSPYKFVVPIKDLIF